MSQRAQTQTTLPRTSQPSRGTWLLLALTAPELEPCSSPSIPSPEDRFFAWRGAQNDVSHWKLWSTHSLLLQPEMRRATGDGSTAVRLHRHPQCHRVLQSVSIGRHLSRIFPAHPRSLALVLIPRPAARRVSASASPPCGFRLSETLFATNAKTFSEPSEKDAAWHLGAGHLASLRARVSRGQSGQIQTGERSWHFMKTTSS